MLDICVKIDEDHLGGLLVEMLQNDIQTLKSDLERQKAGTPIRVFDCDLEVDNKKIRKMIKAMEKVVEYYSVL